MKKLVITLAFLTFLVTANAQIKQTEIPAQSNLEKFSDKAGALIKREYFDIGKIGGMTIQVLRLTDVITNTTVSGLRIEGEDNNQTKIVFLDSDEVDGLIKSLNYMINTVFVGQVPTNNIEYNFTSRSHFRCSGFNSESKWQGYIQIDEYSSYYHYFLTTDDMKTFLGFVQMAKTKI